MTIQTTKEATALAGAVFVDVEVCQLRNSPEYGRRDRPSFLVLYRARSAAVALSSAFLAGKQ